MRPRFVPTSQQRTRISKQLLAVLKLGKTNAITGSRIAGILNQGDDRLIRVIIRELIAEGVPIASSVTEPMGYFIANSDEEVAGYIRALNDRIKEDQSRLRDFEKATDSFSPTEQMQLEI